MQEDKEADKKRAVMDATLALIAEKGFHGTSMSEVAQKAKVAVGTIYHYFSSKDHLLAATLVQWTFDLQAQIDKRPAEGDTVLERVLDLLRRTTRSMRRNAQLSSAIITGLTSPGDEVAQCQFEMHAVWSGILATAFIGVMMGLALAAAARVTL